MKYPHLLFPLIAAVCPAAPGQETGTVEKFELARLEYDALRTLLREGGGYYVPPERLPISEALHLNKYYISHMFKERMNIGFTDFINSLRTEHACELLKKDVSITDVAFSSGFSSIRTFNRVFLENTGMTPRDYIKAKQN